MRLEWAKWTKPVREWRRTFVHAPRIHVFLMINNVLTIVTIIIGGLAVLSGLRGRYRTRAPPLNRLRLSTSYRIINQACTLVGNS